MRTQSPSLGQLSLRNFRTWGPQTENWWSDLTSYFCLGSCAACLGPTSCKWVIDPSVKWGWIYLYPFYRVRVQTVLGDWNLRRTPYIKAEPLPFTWGPDEVLKTKARYKPPGISAKEHCGVQIPGPPRCSCVSKSPMTSVPIRIMGTMTVTMS